MIRYHHVGPRASSCSPTVCLQILRPLSLFLAFIAVSGCSTEALITPNNPDGSPSQPGDDGSQTDASADQPTDPSDDVLALNLDDGEGDGSQNVDDGDAPGDDPTVINNDPPSADAGADVHAVAGDVIVLDASDSTDPDGDALTFTWTQDSGSVVVAMPDANGEQVEIVAPEVNTETELVFMLTVSDSNSSSTDTVSIFVSPGELCPPAFTVTAATTSGLVPLNVFFEVRSPDDSGNPDGDVSWVIDGDAAGDGLSFVHSFSLSGTYFVEACLSSACGFSEVQSRCEGVVIDVLESTPSPGGGFGGGGGGAPPPPAANTVPVAVATGPSSAAEGSTVTLNGTSSSDTDKGPKDLTYIWTQTGGTDVTADAQYSANAAQPKFTAPTFAGNASLDTLAFSLVVYDGADYSPADTVSVSVTDVVVTVTPQNRTADMPDSWLVLYNTNSADSIAWKDWYIAQWGIPAENTLGLNADATLERIQEDDMIDDIFTPVLNHLNANPTLKAKIMGILLGYRLPGNYYTDASTPTLQGGGGWSISSRLQKLNASQVHNHRTPQNAYDFVAHVNPDTDRLNKSELASDVFITARIDAPTLADAKSLTTRARAISTSGSALPASDKIYLDYDDPGSPGGSTWYGLKYAYEAVAFNNPASRFPWQFFDSDGAGEDPTPNCAVRFSYYQLTGWHNADWSGSSSGTKILGYALNSWGATTVRSTTGHSGRYVPNLLFNGGFAGAVGSTGEPYLSSAPQPSTMIWCLAEGRTMAEAVFQATPDHAWMWELVGDPLLQVPTWFP